MTSDGPVIQLRTLRPGAGPLAAVAEGLARRWGDLAAAHRRSAGFVRTGPVAPVAPVVTGVPDALTGRDLLLRMCRTVGEPGNAALLEALADGDRAEADLAGLAGLPVLAAWERVNDLVQVGLAARDLSTGRVGVTASGAAVAAVGRQLLAELALLAPGRSGGTAPAAEIS